MNISYFLLKHTHDKEMYMELDFQTLNIQFFCILPLKTLNSCFYDFIFMNGTYKTKHTTSI